MFDDIAGVSGDDQLPVVQSSYDSLQSTESLRQLNLHINLEVSSLSSEDFVFFLVEDNYDVTSFSTRLLATQTVRDQSLHHFINFTLSTIYTQ
jgi:hypothetical protein